MALQLSATNGGAIVDATDSFDMMDKLIDFIDGTTAGETGKLLPVIERWTVNEDDSVSVPGERHVFLEGPGLAGTDNIHVNIRIYSDVPGNIHNWQIIGATGYTDSANIYDQPGASTVASFLTLSNADMPFWFIVSGRRIIVIAQTAGSISYATYLGWYLPYATPNEFPYPMFNGGSTSSPTVGYLNTNYTVGNFYDGPVSSVTAAAAQLRNRDGSWLAFGTYTATTSATRPAVQGTAPNHIWPNNQAAVNYDLRLIQNVDNTFPVFPFILYSAENGGNTYGELDGVFFSPLGLIGKKFPDTITIASDTYVVINNANRTSEASSAFLLA